MGRRKKRAIRKFGGQYYTAWYSHDEKKVAKQHKARVQRLGYKVRLIKANAGPMAKYIVYKGPKRKR